jgi:hypothetical protein
MKRHSSIGSSEEQEPSEKNRPFSMPRDGPRSPRIRRLRSRVPFLRETGPVPVQLVNAQVIRHAKSIALHRPNRPNRLIPYPLIRSHRSLLTHVISLGRERQMRRLEEYGLSIRYERIFMFLMQLSQAFHVGTMEGTLFLTVK